MLFRQKPISSFTAWALVVDRNACLVENGKHGTKEAIVDRARKAFLRFDSQGEYGKAKTVLYLSTHVWNASGEELALMKEVLRAITGACRPELYSWKHIHGSRSKEGVKRRAGKALPA